MNNFTNNLSSLEWWLGVVFVGIVLNIASSYLRSPLDLIFRKLFLWWRKRSDQKKAEMLEQIGDLKNSEHLQLLEIAEEMRCRYRALFCVMGSIILLLLYLSMKFSFLFANTLGYEPPPYWFMRTLYWGSMVFIFMGFREFMRASYSASLIDLATNTEFDSNSNKA